MQKEFAPQKEHIYAAASIGLYLKDAEGRYLFVQDLPEYGGLWTPITGFVDVDQHETPEGAAVREAKEEMGVDVKLNHLLGVFHYYDDKGLLQVGYAYDGTITGGRFRMQPEEVHSYGFFTPSEIETMFSEGKIRTPQFNYESFKMAESSARYPLSLVRTNGKTHAISV